jgi:hypothetical protein
LNYGERLLSIFIFRVVTDLGGPPAYKVDAG